MKKRSKTAAKSSKILQVYKITLHAIVQNFMRDIIEIWTVNSLFRKQAC